LKSKNLVIEKSILYLAVMFTIKSCMLGYCEAIAASTGQRCSNCAVTKLNNRWVCLLHSKHPPDEYIKPSGPTPEERERRKKELEIIERKMKETGEQLKRNIQEAEMKNKYIEEQMERDEKEREERKKEEKEKKAQQWLERKNNIKERLNDYTKKVGREEKEKKIKLAQEAKDIYVNERVATCKSLNIGLTCSLAWLYNWVTCYLPIQLSDMLKRGDQHLYNRLKAANITYEDFIEYYNSGENKNVELIMETFFSQPDTGSVSVQRMIRTAIEKEIEMKKKGLVTFFHAQVNIFWLFHAVVKIAAKREEKRIKNDSSMTKSEKRNALSDVRSKTIDGFRIGCFINWDDRKVPRDAESRARQMGFKNLDPRRPVQPGQPGQIDDHDQSVRKRLVSVNYSIFGNFGVEKGESTYNYIMENKSVMNVRWLWDDIPYISEDEKDWLNDDFMKRYRKEVVGKAPGLLSLISIPCGQIDNFVYNSLPYGNFNLEFGVHKASEMLQMYTSSDAWDYQIVFGGSPITFRDFHDAQARVTDMCYETYGRNLGIQLTTIDAIDPALKREYIEIIEKKFGI
jgi:Skp family chaperone for outer membrane proteins